MKKVYDQAAFSQTALEEAINDWGEWVKAREIGETFKPEVFYYPKDLDDRWREMLGPRLYKAWFDYVEGRAELTKKDKTTLMEIIDKNLGRAILARTKQL